MCVCGGGERLSEFQLLLGQIILACIVRHMAVIYCTVIERLYLCVLGRGMLCLGQWLDCRDGVHERAHEH